MMTRYSPLPTRFEEKIDKRSEDECWFWTSAIQYGRYGVFWFNGGNVYAHRFSYELYVGVVPDGMLVCHKCDNGLCVNPKHLFLGTPADNMQDCALKGRTREQSGEYNAMAKLSSSDIPAILAMAHEGWYHKDIAEQFGVGRSAIGKIVRGERWENEAGVITVKRLD